MPKPIKTIQGSGIETTRGASFYPKNGRAINVHTREEIRLDDADSERIRRQEHHRRHKRRYA